MKRIHILLLSLLCCCAAACSDGDDVFYSVNYPVTDIQTKIDVTGADPESPIILDIRDHILSSAPVQVGGMYSLDFSVYNGGMLHVKPNTEAPVVTGSFVKEPGERLIRFIYGQEDYTAKTSYYQTEEKDPQTGLPTRMTVFIIDLTEQYQKMYPDREVTRVIRYEYTSTPTR